MATRCETCGAATHFQLSMATANSERVEVSMTGFVDELTAVKAALTALRSYKRSLETRQRTDDI